MAGRHLAQQNVYVVADASQWPEKPDPFVFYHQTYTPGSGMYYWDVGTQAYQRITTDTRALGAFALAAYSAVKIAAPVAVPSMAGGYQRMDFYTDQVVTPRFMNIGLNGVFSANYPGVYGLSLTGSIEHNSSNAGRSFQVRVYNITKGVPGNSAAVGTGRNAEATTVPFMLLTEIVAADAGDEFVVEYGGGDSYTSVVWSVASFSMWSVGEFRGVLGD